MVSWDGWNERACPPLGKRCAFRAPSDFRGTWRPAQPESGRIEHCLAIPSAIQQAGDAVPVVPAIGGQRNAKGQHSGATSCGSGPWQREWESPSRQSICSARAATTGLSWLQNVVSPFAQQGPLSRPSMRACGKRAGCSVEDPPPRTFGTNIPAFFCSEKHVRGRWRPCRDPHHAGGGSACCPLWASNCR